VLLERSAVAVGLMAAAIAVGGFIGRAYTVLRGDDEDAISRGTLVGGVIGLAITVVTVILDILAG
jgi:hypothetical protein